MRIIVQNVLDANLKIDGKEIASIGRGFVLLVSFTFNDNFEVVDKMATKLIGLRVFMDINGKTNLSLKDVNGEILSVSQFTLYADVKKGNRPSFTDAMPGKESIKLYEYFNKKLTELYGPIKTGVFGADMKVNLTNDGPFTLILDSKDIIK